MNLTERLEYAVNGSFGAMRTLFEDTHATDIEKDKARHELESLLTEAAKEINHLTKETEK